MLGENSNPASSNVRYILSNDGNFPKARLRVCSKYIKLERVTECFGIEMGYCSDRIERYYAGVLTYLLGGAWAPTVKYRSSANIPFTSYC